MTKLLFRYSPVYDDNLCWLAGSGLPEGSFTRGMAFAGRYQNYWDGLNDRFFAYFEGFGFRLPAEWQAYLIHSNGKLTSFSDPLTLVMREDLEELTAVLVHELCHVFLITGDNKPLYSGLNEHISERYGQEEWVTQVHLIVCVMARYALVELYGAEAADRLLSPEKSYPGLERTWEILDAAPHIWKAATPSEAVRLL